MDTDIIFPNLVVPEASLNPDAASSSSEVNSNGEASAEPIVAAKKIPTKRKATPKKTAAKKEENDNEPEEPTTPKPSKKRTPNKSKKEEVKTEAKDESDVDNAAGEVASPATPPTAPSSKKRAAKAKANGDEAETPAKKRKTKTATNGDAETPAKTPNSTSKAASSAKVKFPESFEEFSEGDKLLVRMRKEGKNWDEVEKAWTEVTGITPGKDVLRKKENRLRALAVEWKAGDACKLAQFKVQVEEESAAAFKKLEAEKWVKMAEMFKATGSEYSSPGLQKKWELMQKRGEVDAKGVYIGDDVEISDAGALEVEASGGDAKSKENGDVKNEGEIEGEDAAIDEA